MIVSTFKTRFRSVLIPIIIIVAAIVIFVFLKSSKVEQPPVQIKEKVWMVETIPARFESLSPVQNLYGKVESFSMVDAAAPISGVIENVWVKEGQSVKQGDALVSMNLSDLDIPLQQAKADVADASAQVRLQKLAYEANQQRLLFEKKVLKLKRVKQERTQQLITKDLASRTDLDTVKEALVKQEYVVVGAQLAVEENQLKATQNESRLAKAKAVLRQATLNMQRGQLVAPYDARIAKVSVSEGSRVNAGMSMVSFYGVSSLVLRTKLPVMVQSEVQQALDSNITLQAFYTQHNGASGQRSIPLSLTRLAGESTTSGIDAFFRLPPALSNARPGDLMEVSLQGVPIDNVVAIPYSALYGQNQVYIIREGRLVSEHVKVVGDVLRHDELWALILPKFAANTKINITHLPNAVSGLKVSEGVQ
ncbi:efflux RND transporter periplasmic adaptor subunit [Thiomicrorhabdus arctica]|uniref:efflux RND transporter periplasmic adaptor subunit n=1 Tax=Thiomicrorhabdus arctica TaxID=131540 RepID=UPI00035CCBE8|nr:biotin/lipoyl-binding protein [Thiomicrorhabdus arctica]